SSKGIKSKPRSRMADSIPSSVSSPSGSATKVSREIFGWKFFRIVSRQLAIPGLDSQENDRLKFRQNLLPLVQFCCPGLLLFFQSLQTMLTDFWQSQPSERFASHLKSVLTFLLFPL